MALAWVDAEDQTEDEHTEIFVPRTCVLHGWSESQRVQHPSVIWRSDPSAREEHGNHPSVDEDPWMRFFDLLAWLRSTSASRQIPPRTLTWTYDPATGQIEDLVSTARELLARFESGQADEPNGSHELIDWRSINQSQWELGVRATLGEDGEPLNEFANSFVSRSILEDDDEELIHD